MRTCAKHTQTRTRLRATKLISQDVAEAVLKKQTNVMEVNDNDVVNGKVSAYVMQSASQYGGYHSAVVYL